MRTSSYNWCQLQGIPAVSSRFMAGERVQALDLKSLGAPHCGSSSVKQEQEVRRLLFRATTPKLFKSERARLIQQLSELVAQTPVKLSAEHVCKAVSVSAELDSLLLKLPSSTGRHRFQMHWTLSGADFEACMPICCVGVRAGGCNAYCGATCCHCTCDGECGNLECACLLSAHQRILFFGAAQGGIVATSGALKPLTSSELFCYLDVLCLQANFERLSPVFLS